MPLPGIAVIKPTFNPSLSAITQIFPAVDLQRGNVTFVGTQSPHTFVTGSIIKILVPEDYGMPQINGSVVTVIGINSAFPLLFLIGIDSSMFQPFIVPAAPKQFAQAIPVGEVNAQLNGAVKNVLLPYNTIPNSLLVNNPFQ